VSAVLGAVGWASGRAFGLSDEVLAWLSAWSEVQMKCFAYGPADATVTPSSLAPVKS